MVHMGRLLNEQEDIQTVATYLSTQRSYKVVLVIAHSQANLGALKWVCTTEQGRAIEGYVMVSSRIRDIASIFFNETAFLTKHGRLCAGRR